MIRLHVSDDLSPGSADPRLTKEQAHYLKNVMRLRDGDRVRLFNGRDGEVEAIFVADGGRRGLGVLAITEWVRAFEPSPDLDLVVALVKRSPLETIIEKAAELGCRRVRLVLTRRTNADHVRLERLVAIATEAAEQTGRLDVPEIVAPEKLERVLEAWDEGRRLMYCDEGEGFDATQQGQAAPASFSPARAALDALRDQPAGPWAVLIGPEGGFAPEERARLRGLGFCTPVSLGPRILRADTAAISALTLWQAALGDWRAA